MAHKTCVDGTVYDVTGGKTLIGGTSYSIKNGKALVDGTAYEVGFGGAWPDDLDTGLEFVSASVFTLSAGNHSWSGTMEYCNGDGWKNWDGGEISSGEAEKGQCIYIRGTGNTRVTASGNYSGSGDKWTLNGTDIECNGNIDVLADYATVKAGELPTRYSYCYAFMFYNCTCLTKAPSLPATNFGNSHSTYYSLFKGCTGLTAIPSLPATTLTSNCYQDMFYGCTKIKLSDTKTGTYTKEYRIPSSGTIETSEILPMNMFANTGGTFTGRPTINTTYYLDSSNTIV